MKESLNFILSSTQRYRMLKISLYTYKSYYYCIVYDKNGGYMYFSKNLITAILVALFKYAKNKLFKKKLNKVFKYRRNKND